MIGVDGCMGDGIEERCGKLLVLFWVGLGLFGFLGWSYVFGVGVSTGGLGLGREGGLG